MGFSSRILSDQIRLFLRSDPAPDRFYGNGEQWDVGGGAGGDEHQRGEAGTVKIERQHHIEVTGHHWGQGCACSYLRFPSSVTKETKRTKCQ